MLEMLHSLILFSPFWNETLENLKSYGGTFSELSIVLPDSTVLASCKKDAVRGSSYTFTVDGKPYCTYSVLMGMYPKRTITRLDGSGGLTDLSGNHDPCCFASKPASGLFSLDGSISYAPPTYKFASSDPTEVRFAPDAAVVGTHMPLDAAGKLDVLLLVATQHHVPFVKSIYFKDPHAIAP